MVMCIIPSTTRRDAPPGLWLGLIVPALLLRSGFQLLAMDLLSSVAILLTLCLGFQSAVLIIGYAPFVFVYFLESSFPWRSVFVIGFTLCGTRSFLRMYPNSFTVGETLLLIHILVVFLSSSVLFLFVFIILLLVERYSVSRVSCCVLVSLTVSFLGSFLFSQYFVLHRMKFRYFFHCLGISHCTLLFGWTNMFFICVAIVYVYARLVDRSDSSVQKQGCDDCFGNSLLRDSYDHSSLISTDNVDGNSSSAITNGSLLRKRTTPFWLRKVFHFAAGLVFASGLLCSPQLLNVCATCLLALFYLFEYARRRGPPAVAEYLGSLVDPFRDKRDSGDLVFTPVALLLGLSIPTWWPLDHRRDSNQLDLGNPCLSWTATPSAWSGVLSIAVGDSVAALIGRAWGKRRWPGSHRTILGSIASWTSQIVIWSFLVWFYSWPLRWGLLPISLGVLVEAYTEQIDNLVVPLVAMAMFPVNFTK